MSINTITEPTIEQELRLVYEEDPTFAPRVRQAIENGDIDGWTWSRCFYGQVCHNESFAASDLQWKIAQRLGYTDRMNDDTPIESLIGHVHSGDTHQTKESLKTFYEALHPYLPS